MSPEPPAPRQSREHREPRQHRAPTRRRLPPPVWVLAAAAAQRLLPRRAPHPAARAAAGLVAGASGVLMGASSLRFHSAGTTVDPLRPARASSLVTDGANAISRNPMYVGMAGLLVANAVRRRSWTALLPAAAFVALMDRSQIAAEEVALEERFGAEYDDYRARVPRWLGPVR